jgi:hypothetical protein
MLVSLVVVNKELISAPQPSCIPEERVDIVSTVNNILHMYHTKTRLGGHEI